MSTSRSEEERPRARALFLDRDGTLIRDTGYPRDPALVELLPGVTAALAKAKARGFRLVIVSNQSGVGRGIIAPGEARAVQARVEALFAEAGVTFDGVYFCFHAPDEGCGCRKPAPGMLRDAARDLDLDLEASVMVGDKASDIEAGRAAGATTVAFGPTPHQGARASLSSWEDLGEWIAMRDDVRATNG